ncbi:MAG: DUF2249 domain-containing protein [Candidatus Binatia bacterium]
MTDSTVFDVRQIPPAERHPGMIVRAFESLQSGETLTIINDHDPQRLRELFESQRQGQFRWEDVEQGPPIWRVRLTKV